MSLDKESRNAMVAYRQEKAPCLGLCLTCDMKATTRTLLMWNVRISKNIFRV